MKPGSQAFLVWTKVSRRQGSKKENTKENSYWVQLKKVLAHQTVKSLFVSALLCFTVNSKDQRSEFVFLSWVGSKLSFQHWPWSVNTMMNILSHIYIIISYLMYKLRQSFYLKKYFESGLGTGQNCLLLLGRQWQSCLLLLGR